MLPAGESDERLLQRLASPDLEERRAALGALYDRHARAVLNVAWRVTGDRATAEDVTQDLFLGLPGRASSFRGESSLAAWLYRSAVNRAIDIKRRAARRPALRLGNVPDEDLRDAHAPAGEAPPPGVPAETGALERDVAAALAALSDKLRVIAVLRYVEGLSYEALAEVLGVSLGTVKSRLSRAHAALARHLSHLRLGAGGGGPEGDAPRSRG